MTSSDESTGEVQHNTEHQRFELPLNGALATADYHMEDSIIIFTHTNVPPQYEGEGIGSKLARTALEYAGAQGYLVRALCPFMASYIARHPEYHSITEGY